MSLKRKIVFKHYRHPFWYSITNYYILIIALAIAIFFVIWGFLNNIYGEAPWITAGLISSSFLIFAVFFREFYLVKNYQRKLMAQKQLDFHLNNAFRHKQKSENPNKLTLELNNSFVSDIRKKSDAANVLGRISEAHFEVFEMCNVYLEKIKQELETTSISSPRFPVLKKSNDEISKLHRFHLLTWSSIESQNFLVEANNKVSINEKLENAQKAQNVLLSGLSFFPNNENLIESLHLVKEFIVSVKVSHWIEQAERAAFRGNIKRAINHYRDALFFLGRENLRTNKHAEIAEKINLEIEILKKGAFNRDYNKTNIVD